MKARRCTILINLLPTVNNHHTQTALQAMADKIHQ
jgi:hypothetical protein